MKKALLILTGIFISQFSMAQTPEIEWSNTYEVNNEFSSNYYSEIIKVPDNGFAFIAGEGKITRVDENGSVLWSKEYDMFYPNKIDNIGNEEFILLGMDKNYEGRVIAKTDNNGNILWSKTFEAENSDEFLSLSSVQHTSDGGFLIAGSTGVSYEWSDMYVMKTDGNGNKEWDLTYNRGPIPENPEYDYSEQAVDVSESPDGHFYVLGYFNDRSNLILKITNTGNLVWDAAHFQFHSDWWKTRCVSTADNGIVVVGNKHDTEEFDDGTFAYAFKINSGGDLLWRKTYDMTEFGAAADVVRAGNDVVFAGENGMQRIDGSGETIWSVPFTNENGHRLGTYNFTDSHDGGFAAIGTNRDNSFLPSIFKYSTESLTINNFGVSKNSIQSFPNPSNGNFTIKGSEKISTVKLGDLSGKTVYTEIVSAISKTFNLEGRLQSGIYILEIQFENGKQETKKIIIRK